ncbi:MAG: hypothetical protein KC713_06690 [Candidatus Omnitrophica bacterium]|nr:hypothetical protein [Candidatus Omnitrophota bacterium]
MLNRLTNNQAAASFGEYALVIFVVLTVMTSMTVFFKRAISARIYSAKLFMLNEVYTEAKGAYVGNLQVGYEPYYLSTDTNTARNIYNRSDLSKGGRAGKFSKEIDERTQVFSYSETLPPKDAD